jgi:8-hydroxy-5-deazaflavin:NADPH oxidoreductase
MAGLALAAVSVGAQGIIVQTKHPLKIGIIGSGREGGGLGTYWAKYGNQVLFSSRHPEELKDLVARAGSNARAGSPQEAIAFGDVILLAVPYAAMPDVSRDYGPLLKGKIVIDVGNPREDRDGPMANDVLKRGTMLASAEYLPGVRLVRAFNVVGPQTFEKDAFRSGERLAVAVAGEHAKAVAIVSQLVEDSGFAPVMIGGLARARLVDRNGPLFGKQMTAPQMREALKSLPNP